MKKTALRFMLTLTCAALFVARDVDAQDAAAPIRRSPAPEEATPTPAPIAQPTAIPEERPTPAAEMQAPTPAASAVTQTPAAQKAPDQPAATPARRVIREPSVRPAISRPAPVRKVASEPRAEQDPALVPRTKPTFDLSQIGGGYVGATVRALENRWQNAIAKHDVSTIDELIAEDFVATSSTGRKGSKSTLLYEVKRDPNTYTSATAHGMTVRSYGGKVVVVAGTAEESGTTPSGERFTNTRRFTDTWMERGGRWQCISSHATKLPR
jgi:ketosteroid isomerase-like protein